MKKQKLFVGGLLNDNFYEAYYIIDLDQRVSKEIVIDNTYEQTNLVKMIKKQFQNGNLPYGAKDVRQFMPYLINPHSCYKVGDKMLSFMLQAPYFREFDIRTLESSIVTYKDLYDITFSASSIGHPQKDCIYLSINSSNERVFDDAGSIGKRYRRQDEVGTPFCITVDFETVGDEKTPADNCVTVRERDTMQQVRMPISELKAYLAEKLAY